MNIWYTVFVNISKMDAKPVLNHPWVEYNLSIKELIGTRDEEDINIII